MSDDDAAVFRELLAEIQRLNRAESGLEPRVASLEKLMRGNGTPGVAATLHRMDERLQGIESNTRELRGVSNRVDQLEQAFAALKAAADARSAIIAGPTAAVFAVIATLVLRALGVG